MQKTFINFSIFFTTTLSLTSKHSTLLIGMHFQGRSENKGLKFSSKNINLERISNELFILKDVPEILSFLSSKIIKPILLGQ